jgi:toxin ParE1/3/4
VSRKPVIPREAALRDIDEAIDHYYLAEGTAGAALRFVDAVEQAFLHVAYYPDSGSARFAHELELPGLRHWPVKGFPYLVFYHNRDHHLDVWRVLHQERDIPEWLRKSR